VRSRRYRKCDRDDAHDDERWGFAKDDAPLLSEMIDDAVGPKHGKPKSVKCNSDPTL
jgi:hypothetical protein